MKPLSAGGHLIVVTQPQTTQFQSSLRLADPKLLDKGLPALRFSVELLGPDGMVFLSVPGFRVVKGRIIIPSRAQGRFSAETVLLSAAALKLVEQMVGAWKEEFKNVDFPSGDVGIRYE